MMRPLVMDFPGESSAFTHPSEYMFGKSLLVAPVTEPHVTERIVYLPGSAAWYDFWTGKRFDGGQSVDVVAPLDRIPLMVRAGSIIPMGPIIQYSTESSDPVEIRIYPGANGEFTLSEDENDGYAYERGLYSLITFRCDDARKRLTIGARNGSYPGVLQNRTLRVVVVRENSGVGEDVSGSPDRTIPYAGTEVAADLK
jgi:alpha-D-xyloside xylohydrolase